MAGLPNNNGGLPSGVANDLGLGAGLASSESMDEKRRKQLQMQRERMGLSGTSVYGEAASSIFGGGQ